MADFFDDVFGWIKDVAPVVGAVGSIVAPVAGAIMADDANQSAADRVIKATQEQADQLQLGTDEQLLAKLAGYDAARDFLEQRLTALSTIYADASRQFGGDLRSAGTAAAGAIKAAAQRYAERVPAAAQYLGDILVDGTVNAGQALRRAAATGGAELQAAAAMFGDDMVGSGQEFADRVAASADTFRTEIMKAPAAVREMLGAYADAGEETLPQMRARAFADPTRLTGVQQRELDDTRKTLANRIATSGLRGSASAVAAAMDTEARARERMVNENQQRGDKYLDVLGQRGFTAATAIASAEQQALIQAAGVGWEASKLGASAIMAAQQKAAQAAMEARQTAAKWGLDAEKAAQDAYLTSFRQSVQMQFQATSAGEGQLLTADKDAARLLYGTESDVASQRLAAANKIAGETGSFFDTAGRYALSEAGDIGAAAMQKREAEARALGPVAAIQGAADIASANTWGRGIGQVQRVIADERSLGARPPSYPDTMGGGDDTYYGGAGGYPSQYGYPNDPNML